MASALALRLLAQFTSTPAAATPPVAGELTARRFARVRDYIEHNLGEAITLEDLARVAGVNPGWDRTGSTLPDFDDARDIQRTLKGRGLVPTAAADESSTGPASMVLTDPDGNPILIDQHVAKPRK